MILAWKLKIQSLLKKYELQFEVFFFIAGFVFDALLVTEIDHLFSLVQQAVYLFIIAAFLHYEILYRLHRWRPRSAFIEKIWNYRNLLLHFLLGTLLNIYSLFYIKSSSLISSVFFLLIMIGLLVANETSFVKKAKVSLKVGLYSICLFSYISILYPLILGFVGWTPFGLSIVTTAAIFYLQIRLLKRSIPNEKTIFLAVLFPGFSVLALFSIFYFFGWIPPVPLSVKEQGIYHYIEKKEGKYLLSTDKIWWKFWLNADEDFKARPDDKIYYYAQIYSPARFSDQIFIQWSWKDPKRGWQKTDRIPLQIQGGRKEGYRGFTTKSNYQPGQWRVQVETSIGQEISREDFEVTSDSSSELRAFEIVTR